MHRSRSPRSQTIRLAVVYTAMTLVVLTTLAILILFVQGYRFNPSERSLEQGGLIQFESSPTGAMVTVDNRALPRRTNTRLATEAGLHNVTLMRENYRPWQKTITLEPGAVHWVNYARLIPEDIKTETSLTYNKIDQSLAAYEENKLAILPDRTKARIDIVNLSGDEASRQSIELPARLLATKDPTKTRLTLVNWDEKARRLLVQAKVDDVMKWLVIDTSDLSRSVNISSLFATKKPLSEVAFDNRSSRHVYVLSESSLHRVAYVDGTVARPIATNLATFSQSNRGVISFVTEIEKLSGSRTTGYYSPGASQTKTIKTYYDNGQPDLKVRIGEYFGDQYIITQYNKAVEIERASLHPSDNDQKLTPASLATLTLEDGAEYLSLSPTERFVIAQKGASFATYDLESLTLTTTTLRGEGAVNQQLRWLDDFYIWSSRDSQLRLYEFDGANSSLIGDIAKNQTPVLTNNGKYLYFVTPRENSQQSLKRVRLIL